MEMDEARKREMIDYFQAKGIAPRSYSQIYSKSTGDMYPVSSLDRDRFPELGEPELEWVVVWHGYDHPRNVELPTGARLEELLRITYVRVSEEEGLRRAIVRYEEEVKEKIVWIIRYRESLERRLGSSDPQLSMLRKVLELLTTGGEE